MGQGGARIFNLISLLFLLLTCGMVAFVSLRLSQPAPVNTAPTLVLPTSLALPTLTPTFTPSFTPEPTLTLTPTETPLPSETPQTPSPQPTQPTFTPTPTPPSAVETLNALLAELTATAMSDASTATAVGDAAAASATASARSANAAASRTAVAGLPPTGTPTLPPTITLTPSATITSTPFVEPTTPPTVAPTSNVPTATGTLAATLPPLVSGPTTSPFPFIARDQTIFTQNFANSAQCNWQGVGGQVFDINGQPLTGIRVQVFGAGVDLIAVSGSNTLYGPSGWEIQLGNGIATTTYVVQLQSSEGTIISPQVTVTFPADCARNLALVNFVQSRPF
jgi:hypothetical protein